MTQLFDSLALAASGIGWLSPLATGLVAGTPVSLASPCDIVRVSDHPKWEMGQWGIRRRKSQARRLTASPKANPSCSRLCPAHTSSCRPPPTYSCSSSPSTHYHHLTRSHPAGICPYLDPPPRLAVHFFALPCSTTSHPSSRTPRLSSLQTFLCARVNVQPAWFGFP